MPPLFELDGVRVDFDGRRVLDVDALAIPDHGITVLAGPSGSGKSTLLRLCNRLEVPTSGTIRFRGDDIASLDPLRHRRRVGMVFQRPATFPGSVRDNLAVALDDGDPNQLADALSRAGLARSFLDRRADDLSGGEAQRMCLARALLAGPEVLLLDEPTSALDPVASRQLERRARAVADSGMPLVWVTHDLGQTERLADEIVVLHEGHVAQGDERRAFLTAQTHDERGTTDHDERGTADRDQEGA